MLVCFKGIEMDFIDNKINHPETVEDESYLKKNRRDQSRTFMIKKFQFLNSNLKI